ncbi:hypothetical protein [Geodermatophilus sp. SYSU D00710]
MGAVPLTRSSYLDSTGSVRDEPPTEPRESQLDQEQLVIAWGRIHANGSHGWGVATGLDVSATVDAAGLTVAPGIAIDALGQHISLAEGAGRALVGTSNTPVDVIGTGVALPTTGTGGTALSGPFNVTVEFAEFLDQDTRRYRHTPRVRLVASEGFTNDGTRVVLALVQLQDGVVTGLETGLRRGGELPAQRVTLSGPVRTGAAAAPVIGHRSVGGLYAGLAGGLEIRLDDPAAPLHLGGTPGTSAPLTIGAATITAHRPDGTPALELDLTTEAATLKVGSLTASTVSTGTLAATGLTVGNLTASTSLTTPTMTATDLFSTNLSTTNLSTTNLTTWGLTATSVNTSSLSASTLTTPWIDVGQLNTSGQSWLNGQVVAGANTFVNGQFTAKNQSWLNGQVVAGGNTFAKAQLTVDEQFTAKGQSWLNDQVVAGANTFVNGQFTAKNQSWLNGQVVAGGNTFAKAQLTVDGQFTAKGQSWLNGQVVADGNSFFNSAVVVKGFLHKSGGGFLIDHPLAPEDKYLSHSFVESPDMVNLYVGVVETGDDGRATVRLPDFFAALNRDHRFQLTPIGALALATVESEITDNTFTIRTDKPGVTVSWQVTGVRQDPWAEANRIVVEQDKPLEEQGRFLHPGLYGHADDLSSGATAPQLMPEAAASVSSLPPDSPTQPALPPEPEPASAPEPEAREQRRIPPIT